MAQQSSPSAGSRGNKDSKPSGDSNEVVAVLYMKQRILSKVDKNLVGKFTVFPWSVNSFY